jgi:type I restriction enzyme S subunit
VKYYKLNDLCTDIVDCPHTTPDWKNEGIRVVRNFNLKDGNLDFTDGYFVDEATYLERTKRAIPEEGDIIISREAPMGVVGIVPKGLKCCLGQRLVLLKVNKGKCDPYYLLNTLMSDFVQTQFKRADATGSIVSNLCIPDLKEIIIPVIESGQEDVARLLEIINKKQLINNAINDNLEQQLMLLYDYWFTQFDFPDNDGNPYQTSGGKVVWNDTLKRNIPENWKVQSVISNCLSSIIKPGVEIFNTKTYLATADVKGTSISTGTIVDYDGRESRANMQPSINSVWFAKMKNSVKHLYLNKEMQPIISSSILSTGFCGLQCNEISFEYIASYVSNAYFEIHKDMLAHGATQEAVNNDDLAGVHIIIPEDTVLRAYHEATQAIYAQISKNICENQELFKLRDWLLPMLMNGQATISD